jgi:hypothetical protein
MNRLNVHNSRIYTTGDTCFPSAKCTRGRQKNTRGSLPRVQHSGKSFRGCLSRERGLPVLKIAHSGKPTPSVTSTLGEELTPFAPSVFFSKKNSSISATLGEEICFFKKISSSPSATLGEEIYFFKKTLPRVPPSQALGEEYFPLLFKNPSPSAPA